MLTVAIASEAIVSFVATGDQRHFTITLKDYAKGSKCSISPSLIGDRD